MVEKPNFEGAGVDVGVVDSGLDCAGNSDDDFDLACGVSSVASISSSLVAVVGVETAGLLAASVRAEPKALPNKEDPDNGAGLALSSFADGSGLNELSSLKGVEAKRPPEGLSCRGGKAVSALELDPNGFDDLVALPKTLPVLLLLFATDAKPPWPEKPAKPPDEGVADGDEVTALPNALLLLSLFAKPAKPDCPKAEVGAVPTDDEVAHGDGFPPN